MSEAKTIEERVDSICRWTNVGLRESVVDVVREAYFDGLREGVTLYAWHKDGQQFVGTCGRTLKEALAEIDRQEAEAKK